MENTAAKESEVTPAVNWRCQATDKLTGGLQNMELIDWAITAIGGGLSVWMLRQWWERDERIRGLAVALAIVFLAVIIVLMVAGSSYERGVRAQYETDQAAIRKEWLARLDSSSAIAIADFTKCGRIATDFEPLRHTANPQQVSRRLISDRSYLLLFGLWLVISFVALAPSWGPPKPNSKADSDKSEK